MDGVGLVVWAGQAGPTAFFDDLWAYDPRGKRLVAPPERRAEAGRALWLVLGRRDDGRLWISHGFTEDGVRFSDTRAYDFDAGRWTDETPDGTQPVVRCLHACWLTADGRFALYAGQTTGVRALGDLWTLNEGEWAMAEGELRRSAISPPRRGMATTPWCSAGSGSTATISATSIVSMERRSPSRSCAPDGARPPARAGAALIDDPGTGGSCSSAAPPPATRSPIPGS